MSRRPGSPPPLLRPSVALLALLSGVAALVYQVAWFRLFRLSFGSSTAANAAVLAVFMGGLGLGGLLLGRKADRSPRPLRFYAGLEAGVALTAALSPWLADLAHSGYVAVGGTSVLGDALGTLVRLLLAALVLALPTFLMGGTLPALARAMEGESDRARRTLAVLYGANTVGAVVGALAATFVTLERLGIQDSILAAAALNLAVAGVAVLLARRLPALPVEAPGRSAEASPRTAPLPFVLTAAGVVGFVFFLMELVWYRMLAPLLGGSSYTFGLVLAVALAGVGLGGFAYSMGRRERRPTLATFAWTCALEALALAVPWALGDSLALLAMLLRPVGSVSFALLVGAWAVVALVVVLPAAVVAGYQFPLLVGLLGAGRRDVGREVGATYAANTAGAIAGALAGGFGLLPLLGAPGAWRLSAGLLVALALTTLGVAWAARRARRPGSLGRRTAIASAAWAVAALILLAAPGPSAFWRHSPIGAGAMPPRLEGPNEAREIQNATRRAIVWEQEGVESSVAVHALAEISFLIHGKSDGSALRDAPTQVMSGLIGAALHPEPRRALVIGLGTGQSAGWLAEVPGMERVDVLELEPAILHVAELCAPVNHQALEHPKVRIEIGDGREHLLTTRETYDLIFSEPSNPYRAGIASLFTVELYEAAAERLGDEGLFLQWLQGYGVDAQGVRTAMATLGSVFPYVESWQVHSQDLLLVAGKRPIDHDLGRLEERMDREPWKSALRDVNGVAGVAGFYTGYLASSSFTRALRRVEETRNTDDHPVLEFGFVRNLGRRGGFDPERLRSLARVRGEGTPSFSGGAPPDPWRVEEMRLARDVAWGGGPPLPASGNPGFDRRAAARKAYLEGDLASVPELWQGPPLAPMDRVILAETRAEAGDPTAVALAEELRDSTPATAEAVLARLAVRRGDSEAGARRLTTAFEAARRDPWIHRPLLRRALELAVELAASDPRFGPGLLDALAQPFVVRLLDEDRRRARLEVAAHTDFTGRCVDAFAPFEPWVPWERRFLERRAECYRNHDHPLAQRAHEELEAYVDRAPAELVPE